jgi:chorismate mutase
VSDFAAPAPDASGEPAAAGIPPELAHLRHSIDNIDAALIYLLAERFKATKQVGVLKAQRGLPASDPGREERQVARLRELAHSADLDPVFAEKFLAFIVAEVIRHHEALAQDHQDRSAES